MEIDEDKVDDAVLALLRLTLYDGQRAWKGSARSGEERGVPELLVFLAWNCAVPGLGFAAGWF
ncbi:MAG TPA: hypothetical protein VFZ51_04505, partial [Woeseiaceae bacterium]